MAEFIVFDEGMRYIAQNGLPATSYFLLSERSCNDTFTSAPHHLATDTLAGGVGEITGTGYTRQSQATPAPTSDDPPKVSYLECNWATGTAGDWPTDVRSVVLVTTANNTGKAICGWNLNEAGVPTSFAFPQGTLGFTPTLNLR